ncbi:sugar transferase, partial [Staphylococcus aureus]
YLERATPTRSQLAAKRALDVLLAGVGLLLASPVLAAAALAIKLTDGGPVLYRQTRVGRYGATFDVLKLRTMVPEAPSLLEQLQHLNER